jgi:glycosyltransferase involved in cell wall biosynthesis
LADDPFNLPAAVLKDKVELFAGANLTIVTPSRWMGKCAKESRLFKDLRVEVIPNSLETDIYYPALKAGAKKAIGIPRGSVTILFGAETGTDKRKGFAELHEAIRSCSQSPEFDRLRKSKKINILCFGVPHEKVFSLGLPVFSLGYVHSDDMVRNAYSATDVFVLPSLEDNLPNTMLESMSCGTPVVAFDAGGMPDAIVDGVTGRLVPAGDTDKLGEAVLGLVLDAGERETMGNNCRRVAEESYSPEVQAGGYLRLFRELCNGNALASNRRGAVINRPPAKIMAALETGVGKGFQGIYGRVMEKAAEKIPPWRLRFIRIIYTSKPFEFAKELYPKIYIVLTLWHTRYKKLMVYFNRLR